MNIKKVFFAGVVTLLMSGLEAQPLADAQKLLYYDRYDRAARQLHALLKADPNNKEAWWLLTQVYMLTGMAIPRYQKLIEIIGKDTANRTNRKHRIESYGYIAAYRANMEKDYAGSIDYFEKLLELDPTNSDARRYIGILKKNLSKAESKAASKATQNTDKEAVAKPAGNAGETKAETSKANE